MREVGGETGLTERPAMLERWVVTGPEINHVVKHLHILMMMIMI